MLQHDDKAQQDVPAARVRVTAEEFARAVARCQARREEAAQHLEGTVTIGEAVQELGLEATPEEILAEVQAARTQRGAQNRPRARRVVVWAGAMAACLFVALSVITIRQERPAPPVVPPPAVVALETTTNTIEAPGNTLVLDKNQATPQLDTLDNIRENRPVLCDLTTTVGRAAFTNYSGSGVSWTLVKHEGRVYVRAWIANMSRAALKGSVVTLYTVKGEVPSGAAPVPVTLRLDGFQCDPSQSNDQIITAKDIAADSHFSEPWR